MISECVDFNACFKSEHLTGLTYFTYFKKCVFWTACLKKPDKSDFSKHVWYFNLIEIAAHVKTAILNFKIHFGTFYFWFGNSCFATQYMFKCTFINSWLFIVLKVYVGVSVYSHISWLDVFRIFLAFLFRLLLRWIVLTQFDYVFKLNSVFPFCSQISFC